MSLRLKRGLIRDRSQLPDLLLIDEADLGHQCIAVFPTTIPLHLPLGIVGEGDDFSSNSSKRGGVDATHLLKVLLVESLELVDGALEEHLRRATAEASAGAVVHSESPNGDFVDGIHPFDGTPRTIEGVVGHPDHGVGVGTTRIRIIAIPNQGDLVARARQNVDPSRFETFPLGGHGQITHPLTDVAHDLPIVAVLGKHEALTVVDLHDRADDEFSKLHRSSIVSR